MDNTTVDTFDTEGNIPQGVLYTLVGQGVQTYRKISMTTTVACDIYGVQTGRAEPIQPLDKVQVVQKKQPEPLPVNLANVTRLRHVLPVGRDIEQALQAFESGLRDTISQARAAGLPQGLLSSLLSAYSLQETQKILSGGSQ